MCQFWIDDMSLSTPYASVEVLKLQSNEESWPQRKMFCVFGCHEEEWFQPYLLQSIFPCWFWWFKMEQADIWEA